LREILISLLVIPGMILVVNNIDVSHLWGFVVGVLSALLAAIFTVLNKKYIDQSDKYTITFIEMWGAWMMMSLILIVMWISGYDIGNFLPQGISDWIYLLFLVILCTTIAQYLNLSALSTLSAFATNLVSNLEPVYGILMAIFILNEHHELSTMFYVGAALILGTVFCFPLLQKKSY
jgi:drug/metabolite transporter (DMT)-like permease